MSDPWTDYRDGFRANMPAGVTYDPILARYIFLGKRFAQPWQVVGYRNYLRKTGFLPFFIEEYDEWFLSKSPWDGQWIDDVKWADLWFLLGGSIDVFGQWSDGETW